MWNLVHALDTGVHELFRLGFLDTLRQSWLALKSMKTMALKNGTLIGYHWGFPES